MTGKLLQEVRSHDPCQGHVTLLEVKMLLVRGGDLVEHRG